MYFELKHLKNTRFEVVELLVSLVFALSCLLFFWFFPLSLKGDLVESFLKTISFLVVFPIFYTKIILKKSLQDLFLGKPRFSLKSNLFLLLSLIISILIFLLILNSSLFEFYKQNLPPIIFVFKGFLVYEIVLAIFLWIYIFFTFGFVNLITRNFPKLNLFLVLLFYYFLNLDPFHQNLDFWKKSLVVFLSILPMIFFRRIVNEQRSIWFFFLFFFILNLVFDAIIIKLSL